MIAVIDYGAGNLMSVKNALAFLGAEYIVSSDPGDITGSGSVILPGVGSFGSMMEELDRLALAKPIKKAIEDGKPFLGICLGMQALFDESEECPGTKGLGVLRGKVLRFRAGRIPQIGWNRVTPVKDGVLREGFMYFANSYHVSPEDEAVIAAKTNYYGGFASAVRRDNVLAVQFHPEKSGVFGLEMLRRWLRC